MSNRAHFSRTKFSDVDGGNATFGYRAFDAHEMYYDNSWATPGPEDDMEFLHHVRETASEGVQDLFEWMRENQRGCYINGNWYSIEEIESAMYRLDEVKNFTAGNHADKEE